MWTEQIPLVIALLIGAGHHSYGAATGKATTPIRPASREC